MYCSRGSVEIEDVVCLVQSLAEQIYMYACSCWEQKPKLLIPLTRLSEFPNLEAAAYSELTISPTVNNMQS
jgi:hypothetical protein